MAMEFDWDPVKADSNIDTHGISFSEAATVFADPLSITISDPRHSIGEDRYVLFGRSSAGRLLAVMHTERGSTIRIISARHLTSRERKEYEEGAI